MNVQGDATTQTTAQNISAPAPRRPMLADTAPPPVPPVFPPPPRRRRSGLIPLALAVLSVGLGAAALTLAIIAWPASPRAPAPGYTAAQISAAKTRACTAAKRAIADLRTTSHTAAPNSMDDALGWANVATDRAARLSAAVYLPTQIVDPATPADLKNATTEFAAAAGDSLALSLSGTNMDQYTKDTAALNASAKEIERLC